MKFRVDFCSLMSLTVEADNEDAAVELAQRELYRPANYSTLISNADVTGVEEVQMNEDE